MGKNKLILTVGLPRSGKSTWAKTQGVPVVNPDSVRLALHGKAFVAEAERMVWTVVELMIKSLFLAGHGVVILDACNITKKRQDEWKSFDWDIELKEFDATEEVCIERALSCYRPELVDVIRRMAKSRNYLT